VSIRKGGYRRDDEPIFVVISEHDTHDPMLSHGAIILEQYTMDSEDEVFERAVNLSKTSRYGRIWIGKVEVQCEVDGDKVIYKRPRGLPF